MVVRGRGHERLACRAQAGRPALDRAGRAGPRGVRRAGGARAGGTGRAGRSLAATLDALGVPAEDPGPSWFLDVLTGPSPGGVRSDPGPGGRGLTTLCTLVADLTAGEAVIAPRGEPPVAIPLADLSEGNPSRSVQF